MAKPTRPGRVLLGFVQRSNSGIHGAINRSARCENRTRRAYANHLQKGGAPPVHRRLLAPYAPGCHGFPCALPCTGPDGLSWASLCLIVRTGTRLCHANRGRMGACFPAMERAGTLRFSGAAHGLTPSRTQNPRPVCSPKSPSAPRLAATDDPISHCARKKRR